MNMTAPGYHLSDTKTQANIIKSRLALMEKFAGHPIDPRPPIETMVKRVKRFYGLHNKYDGKGRLR